MQWLPLNVKLEIAKILDAATGVRGIDMFAERLGFREGVAYMRVSMTKTFPCNILRIFSHAKNENFQ